MGIVALHGADNRVGGDQNGLAWGNRITPSVTDWIRDAIIQEDERRAIANVAYPSNPVPYILGALAIVQWAVDRFCPRVPGGKHG